MSHTCRKREDSSYGIFQKERFLYQCVDTAFELRAAEWRIFCWWKRQNCLGNTPV